MDFKIPKIYNWLNPPDNFLSLKQYLEYLKNESNNLFQLNFDDTINYILVPHAGIRYSGLCSMSAYLPASKNKNIKNILLLSTDHNENEKSGIYNKNLIFENDKNKYRINVNLDVNKLLLSKYNDLFKEVNLNDEKEHALYNQIPFISYLFPNVNVIGIKIGKNELDKISSVLSDIIDDSYLVVCNTDLSHINGHFKDKIENNIYDTIRYQDSQIIKHLNNLDNNDISNLSLCGYNALLLMKKIVNKKNLICKISSYYSSLQLEYFIKQDINKKIQINDLLQRFEISDIGKSSVSYIGLVFTEKNNITLTEFENQSLIHFSISTAINYFEKKDPKIIEPIYSPSYYNKLAAFITIDNLSFTDMNQKQRGCIGTVDVDRESLIENIRYFTLQSCFYDSRYKPITLDELTYKVDLGYLSYYICKKKISITVIKRKIDVLLKDFINKKTDFILGEDTVNLEVNGKNSVYLTKDAVIENLNSEIKILKMLCRKGGNKEDCLLEDNIKVNYQPSYCINSQYDIFLFNLTYKIYDFKKDLNRFIKDNHSKFRYKKIGLLFKKINTEKKNEKKIYLLYGILWYYIYILECHNPQKVITDLGYSNCFLFLKQVTQIKMFKKLGQEIIDIVFNEYFITNLNQDGIPPEMVRENIAFCCGMIQWIYIGSPKNLPQLLDLCDKICINIDKYPDFLNWKWFNDSINKKDINLPNHYININGVFNLFYGLYLTEWVNYSHSNFKVKNKIWLEKLKIFNNKLNSNNLSLHNFISSLMKIKDKWNPRENNYLAWLINHIPYFLSAFYEYDLTKIKNLRINSGWIQIINFIKISGPNLKESSWDYYGECVEILDKLGYNQKKEIKIIQDELKDITSRIKILEIKNRPFSDIHTIVTYVMQPNAEDVMKTNINKNYGKYVKKIINSLDKKKTKKKLNLQKGKTKKFR